MRFPGYREVEIRDPVHVVGIPRSGTTYMHRALAAHPGFTSLRKWELLLAPSVTKKKFFFLLLGRLDRARASMAETYESQHRYSLEDFGLTETDLVEYLGTTLDRFPQDDPPTGKRALAAETHAPETEDYRSQRVTDPELPGGDRSRHQVNSGVCRKVGVPLGYLRVALKLIFNVEGVHTSEGNYASELLVLRQSQNKL